MTHLRPFGHQLFGYQTFSMSQNHMKTLLKLRLLGPTQSFWFKWSKVELENLHFKKFLGGVDFDALRNRLWQSVIYNITTSNLIIVLVFPFHKENLIQIYHNGTGRNPWSCYNLANIRLITFLMGRKLFGKLNRKFWSSNLSLELLSKIDVEPDIVGWRRTLQLLYTSKQRHIHD